jgi:hypothetical protein
MPLSSKGEKIMSSMKEQYGPEKGKSVFYASKNAGTIKGVDRSTGWGTTPSKNKGTISGVDTGTKITHSRSIPGLGRTTVTHTSDTNTVDSWFRDGDGDKGGPLMTGPYKVPERHKDLLGEVSQPETTPRGPMTEAKAPERTKSSGDKKAKDQSSTFSNVQSGAPMNNLGMGIPAPNVSGHPGVSTSTSTGDSLSAMNARNRAFWARKR